MSDSRTRKWNITINNPSEHNMEQDTIKEVMSNLSKSVVYWCMADEIGLEDKTPHTHLYIACNNAIKFSQVKKAFPSAHIEMAKGTSQQNKDYVFKRGKWSDTDKHDTKVEGTEYEWGEVPAEQQGRRSDLEALYDMLDDGMTDAEIMRDNPTYMLQIDKLEKARQAILMDKYKDVWRDLEVEYIYGDTGTGKTRGIMERYGYSKVYRVTDYSHPFDSYKGQDTIIFEEFRSSLKCQDMLNYLDGYPIELPCRYANRQACYTRVYIITNIPLSDQYVNVQTSSPETFRAFRRRIHKVTMATDTTRTDKWEQVETSELEALFG